MAIQTEKRILQFLIMIACIVPVLTGFAGMFFGADMLIGLSSDGTPTEITIDHDSHFRYLSGLLMAIGFVFLSTVPGIERKGRLFYTLTLIVFIGGIARLSGFLFVGIPNAPMQFGLLMELVITPLLCLWQWRIARAYGRAENSPIVTGTVAP